jgi:hypothetical protein
MFFGLLNISTMGYGRYGMDMVEGNYKVRYGFKQEFRYNTRNSSM